MENAPTIIMFWFVIAVIFVLMVVSMIAAIVIHKKRKNKELTKMQFVEKLCLTLGIIFSVPIILVLGYVLYIYI